MAYKNYFLIDTHFSFEAAVILPFSHFFFNLIAGPTLLPTDSLMETVLKNGIKIYKDPSAIRQISDLVIEYLSIWES